MPWSANEETIANSISSKKEVWREANDRLTRMPVAWLLALAIVLYYVLWCWVMWGVAPAWVWFLGLAGGALPAYFFKRLHRKCLRKSIRLHGFCFRCGYDLTGNESGTCPECGNQA